MTDYTTPLCVDLDGTLIRNDTVNIAVRNLLQRNKLNIFLLAWWLLRGRAYLKKQLAQRISLDPVTLSYNEKFLAWVKQQKQQGRFIVLVTATDRRFAIPIAEYLNIFDEVLASDGKINLRSKNKRNVLIQRFGINQYDYCGNDYPDIPVWQTARKAIVVNAPQALLAKCQHYKNLGEIFE